MKTSTKVLIAVGVLLYLRSRNKPAMLTAPAMADGQQAYAPAGGSWIGTAPVTPTFQGGEAGYGTNPISALFTALLGGNVQAQRPPSSASAPLPGTNVNDPYNAGSTSAFGAAAVPGVWGDPNASVGNTATAADPSILMMPLPFGDGILWTPSPSVAG